MSYIIHLSYVYVFSTRFAFEIKLKSALSYLHAALPADPQVSSGEETGHGMPGQVVDPTLLSQLGHDGVNPGKTSPTLSPLGQSFWVLVPWNLEKCDMTTTNLVTELHTSAQNFT